MSRSIKILALLALSTVIVVAACDNSDSGKTNAESHEGHDKDGADHAGHDHEAASHGEHINMWEGVTKAICVMSPTEGSSVSGTVSFVEADGKVAITWDISGLNANKEHAIHVHQYGDISGSDGKATGGHYNPDGHEHGLPDTSKRHAGDLGNLQADAEGKAAGSITVDNMTIAGMKNPIIGRGMIIHAVEDDGGQPTGNAGARIAQGVIGIDE